MTSAWIYLLIAGILEICWSVGLKYTDGFSRLVPSVLVVFALTASIFLLAKAAQTLPIGTAYAVWVGIGAVGAGVLGILLFKEPATLPRVAFMILLLISIIGLKATATH